MYAVNVVLVLGALFLALFCFLFLAGALGHLLVLIAQGVRAVGRTGSAKAQVRQSAPAAPPAIPFRAAQRPRRRPLAALLAERFQRHVSGGTRAAWLKTCAVVLGLLAVGFVAITVSDDTASSSRAVPAPAVPGAAATAATPAMPPAARP